MHSEVQKERSKMPAIIKKQFLEGVELGKLLILAVLSMDYV